MNKFSILDINHEFFFTKLSQIFVDLFKPNTNLILDFLPSNISSLNLSDNYVDLIIDVNVFSQIMVLFLSKILL